MPEDTRLRHDLNVAARVQSKFISRPLPQVDGFDISAHYQPCEFVSGDYIDAAKLDDRRIALTVGDVSGKGLSAGLVVAMLRTFMDMHLKTVVSPTDLVLRLNDFLYQNVPDGMFVTMFFGLLDTKKNTITYVNCGHLPPIVYEHGTKQAKAYQKTGMAVRVRKTADFFGLVHEQQIALQDGDTLVVYTDGVTEAPGPDNDLFEMERLQAVIAKHGQSTAKTLIGEVLTALEEHTRKQKFTDDVTILAVQKLPTTGPAQRVGLHAHEADRLLTVQQAIQRFGCDEKWLRDAIRRSQIKAYFNQALMDMVVKAGDVATLLEKEKSLKPTPKRVLIAASDTQFGEIIELEIRTRAQVKLTSVSPDAVSIAEQFEPDVIVFEISEPFQRSLEVLGTIRQKLSSAPVIAYSNSVSALNKNADVQTLLRQSGIKQVQDKSLGARAVLPLLLARLSSPK